MSIKIEPKVKPLVDKMNATGLIQTIASCQGHEFCGKPPYVYFRTSSEVAASIEKILRDDAMSDDAKFINQWVVEGKFNENFDLVFILYSPKYHTGAIRLSGTLSGLFGFFWLPRKQLDKELLALVDVIEQAVIPYIRHEYKPQITTC